MKSTHTPARLRRHNRLLSPLSLLLLLSLARVLTAQDTRTVVEPTIPAVCMALLADLTVSGGEPSSELGAASDTSRIQTALTGCGTGKAVELSVSGANSAFLIGPLTIPKNVTLLVDGGVTVFGSRNPADYQSSTPSSSVDTCGVDGTHGNGCNSLFTMSSSGEALMGYGVINGRGGDKTITVNSQTNPTSYTVNSESWWDLANDARTGTNNQQNNPIMVSLSNATSAVLYKISLLNSPHFHVKNNNSSGFTVWGAKIITPFTARNSDGIDPTGVTNMTVANSVIGDGDDEIAISGSSAASNFSFTNLLLPSGHGVSIGSITTNGVSNVLANGLYFSGQPSDQNAEGLHIKSSMSNGGLVKNVTYENVCIQNVAQPIQIDAFYSSTAGTSYPTFTNITYANVHVLGSGKIELSGYGTSNLSTVNFDNVVFDGTPAFSPAWQNATITFTDAISGTSSPQVYPASLTTNAGTNVTYTNAATLSNANAYACPATVFPALVGEEYLNSSTTNNLKTLSVTNPTTFTVNAVVEPTNSEQSYAYTNEGSYTGVPLPTAAVNFYDSLSATPTVAVGSGSLSANGTLATLSISNPTAGTHTYTAKYAGDTNYTALAFGSVTVTVTAGAAAELAYTTAPAATPTYGASPGTVAVAVEDAGGNATTSTASVTLTVTGPNSYSKTYTVNAVSGTATFSSISNPPSVGTYTYTATSTGLTSASVSETVSAATLNVAAQPASRIFGAANPAFTATLSGYVNGDTSSVVSGAPVLTTTAVPNSPAANYPITAAIGTLTAANYVFAATGSTLTVNGGAPQIILFQPLPSFPHGASYQLAATASSGLPITYTATGAASVSGSTLTVNATGPVTITAAQPGNASYAAATNVSQTFTAQ
jgi:polygalacturonase